MDKIRRDGYVIDVPYPLHFYKEMQPAWLNYVITTLGCTTPDITQAYRYCELGCGAGINTLVAAAGNPNGQFIGIDFNKDHISAARQAAASAGLDNVEFIEASFEEFARQDLGQFDFIVTHGVWSWLPSPAKMAIMQIIHQSLKPQGLLYLQYMSYPGAARLVALQKVLHEVSLTSQGSSANSIRQGLALLRRLADAGAGLFIDNPEIEQELAALEKENLDYLAHDFLTHHWQPEHSADLHRLISQTGVSYIGSANVFENMDTLSIPGNVQGLLDSIPSRSLKETVRDMARNQNQRADLFQKQPQSLAQADHLAALEQITFKALETLPAPGAMEFQTPIGRIPGPQEIFAPLITTLQTGPSSFAELRRIPVFENEPGLLLQTLNMLMWAGHIHPLRNDARAAPKAQALQAWLTQQGIPLLLEAPCGNAVQLSHHDFFSRQAKRG